MQARGRLLILAVPLAVLVVAVAGIAGIAADPRTPVGTDRPVAAATSVPTLAEACQPFAAAAGRLATHTGPLPAQSAWDRLATGNSNGATSLHDATTASDLVLVGRWVGTERFGTLADPAGGTAEHYAIAVIRVDRLAHGTLPPGCVDLVRVPFLLEFGSAGSPFPEATFAELERTRPRDPALLFLHSWGGAWARAGGELPAWVTPLDRTDIFRTIGIDGAMPLEDGRVSDVVFEHDVAPWRVAVAGAPLDGLLADVVDAAAQP